ncbi:hypothetical protein N9L68_01505 [bacterium]|nr:hypothetical protein [bacterium]
MGEELLGGDDWQDRVHWRRKLLRPQAELEEALRNSVPAQAHTDPMFTSEPKLRQVVASALRPGIGLHRAPQTSNCRAICCSKEKWIPPIDRGHKIRKPPVQYTTPYSVAEPSSVECP